MKDLQVLSTPPALTFDYEGLKKWAEGITENYLGLVVTEDMVTAIKNEMAGLNKMKASLEQAKRDAVAQVSAPIREFEAQIREVVAIFDAAYTSLAEQVKAFAEQQREDKQREVEFLITATLDEHGQQGLVIPIQDAWLNKAKSKKSIKAELVDIIQKHVQAERDRKALEQAKQDRAVAIEEKVASLAQTHGFAVPVSAFLRLHDLTMPLSDVNAEIQSTYEAKAKLKQAAHAVATAQPPAPTPAPPVASIPRAPAQPARDPSLKSLTITMEFEPWREQAVLGALKFLESLCVSFEAAPDDVVPSQVDTFIQRQAV